MNAEEVFTPEPIEMIYKTYRSSPRSQTKAVNPQQIIDSNITRAIINLESEYRLAYFWEKHHQLSDSVYWSVLATIWMDTPVCSPNSEYWETLFRSPRRNRQKMMKKSDRKTWRRLPNTAIAYRAVNNPEEAKTALSWTLDKVTAAKLSDGREVVYKLIPKTSIIAYFDRRHEQEIIVLL